jgi:hypothetical protein
MSNSSRHRREYRVARQRSVATAAAITVTTLGSRVFMVGLEPAVAET